jgi:hypothetical protein
MIDVIRDFLNIPSTLNNNNTNVFCILLAKVWCDVREYVKFYLQTSNWNFYSSHVLTQIFLLLPTFFLLLSRNILFINSHHHRAKIKFEVFRDEKASCGLLWRMFDEAEVQCHRIIQIECFSDVNMLIILLFNPILRLCLIHIWDMIDENFIHTHTRKVHKKPSFPKKTDYKIDFIRFREHRRAMS